MDQPEPIMAQDYENVVEVRNLSMRFGSLAALGNINLTIPKGELFGLLGPNGAGKTTLISILATMLSGSSGEARICGYDVRSDQDLVRKSIGIVFQDPSLDEELTGEENLDLHGRLYGLHKDLRKSRIEEVLDLVDLEERRRDRVKTYSGGMRRRLEIGRGLMHIPRLLFLDEPTLGLDPQTRRRIWGYIKNLKQNQGTTIILTTHYMDEADNLCDRIAIIDKGEIVSMGTPAELKSSMGGDLVEMVVNQEKGAFLAELGSLEDISGIESHDRGIRLTAVDGGSSLPLIFKVAGIHEVEISSVAVRTPNLEDVFLKLTGRNIRDDEAVETKDRMRIYMSPRRK